MDEKIVVLVTAGEAKNAEAIARALVEERLAACVNVLPGMRSFYQWEGKIQDDAELLLIIKTRTGLFEKVRERVLALHAYDLPEVIGFPIAKGHAPYLGWIGRETGE